MPRKARRRRRFRRYLRGTIDENLSLGTLAGKTVVGDDFDEVVNERTFVSSIDAVWAIAEYTAAAADGPILVGIAHSDYTDAEIEAWIESSQSWNEGDMVAQEVAKRKIRRVGMFRAPVGATAGDIQVLNEGKPIHTKCNWILNQGQTLKQWAYNVGTSALATTVPIVSAQGHANLWPR